MTTRTVLGLLTAAALVVAIQVAYGDYDSERGISAIFERSSSLAPASEPRYVEECGGCHIAYPPALLPARSWEKIMAQLADHYGDSAELDAETRSALTAYLVQNSSEHGEYRHARRITRSVDDASTPTRIMDIPYIRHEHEEIPERLVTGNPQVKSFSNCGACHRQVAQGSFSEREVRIPDFGRWDD